MFHDRSYILEVYRQRSFSKAAQVLYISQPSLSHAVRRTEELIGGEIFDRSYKPLILTDLGKKYIDAALRIQDITEDFRNYLEESSKEVTGTLAIGGTTTFTSILFPRLVSSFIQCFPKVRLQLVEAASSDLAAKLMNGSLDLVMDNGSMSEDVFSSVPFQKDDVILAVPRRFRLGEYPYRNLPSCLAAEKAFRIEDLPVISLESCAELPFICLKEGNDTRKRSDLMCSDAGFIPHILFEPEQQIAAYNLALAGLGIAFVGELLVSESPRVDKLEYWRISSEHSHRSICAFYKKNRHLSRALQAFIHMLSDKAAIQSQSQSNI